MGYPGDTVCSSQLVPVCEGWLCISLPSSTFTDITLVGRVTLAMVGIFIPHKLAHIMNQGFLFPPENEISIVLLYQPDHGHGATESNTKQSPAFGNTVQLSEWLLLTETKLNVRKNKMFQCWMNSPDKDKLGKIKKWRGNGTAMIEVKKQNPSGLQKWLRKYWVELL